MNIGIVGLGFVGNALYHGMKHSYDIVTFDKFKKCSEKSIQDLVKKTSIIFVCVPTPMNPNGSCETSIVSEVVLEIDRACSGFRDKKIVVIKSTVPPGTTASLNDQTEHVHVAFNPEFLREVSAVEDFINQDRIVLGSEDSDTLDRLEMIYGVAYPDVVVLRLGTREAEMVKYTTNCFLATKVSFANELFQICSALGVDYNKMIEAAQYDKRLGDTHWMVPGPMPDHKGTLRPGFSGSCFVKDINSLMFVANKNGVDAKVMKSAWNKNLEVRPEKDWEHLKGRAVI